MMMTMMIMRMSIMMTRITMTMKTMMMNCYQECGLMTESSVGQRMKPSVTATIPRRVPPNPYRE